MPLAPHTRLGRYEIRSLLGVGGMGEVYLAQDTTLHRFVAVKLLRADITANQDWRQRFEREAYSASSLNHPNILTIHEIGSEAGLNFIVTEFIEGESLRQRLGRTRMDLQEVLEIGIQIASALSAAHSAGVVHRDIKPENLMLRQDGFVKVLDFGLAKLVAKEPPTPGSSTLTSGQNTEVGVVMGTFRYMSPEQARGLQVDARTDLFSLGILLYEMAAGRLPFAGETTSDLISEILKTEPTPISAFALDAPAELERIVSKALRKNKEERYQSAKEMALDLKSLKQQLEFKSGQVRDSAAQTASAASSSRYVLKGLKQHRQFAAVIAALLLITVAAVSFWFVGRPSAIHSLAVMPFVNGSNNPDMEYLSDGISESLTDRLAQLPQLKVIARSSTFKFKGKDIDPPEVAKALSVRAIVTGRVTQHGDNLLVSAELVDARDKTQMWGEHYSRKSADLQAVQEEIARTISEKLRLRLTGAQQQRLLKRATADAEAYQLYMTGLSYARKGGTANRRKALEYYNKAIARDPKFAQAYAQMSASYSALAYTGEVDPREAVAKSKAAAHEALALDETLEAAHTALGLIKRNEWDWAGADSELRRAVEVNPGVAGWHMNYAAFLSQMGRPAEALTEAHRAMELDPLRITTRALEGEILHWARRYDEAIQSSQNLVKIEPDFEIAHLYLGYSYSAKGMYPEAIAEYQKRINVKNAARTGIECYLGYALAKSGKRGEALKILDNLKTTKEYVSPFELAVLYTGLDDKDAAFASLERAYTSHDLQMQFLKVEPSFDPLRRDRRFDGLMRRVGLPNDGGVIGSAQP